MLHIVFDEKDARALEAAFELDEDLAGPVVVCHEDWSVGPIIGIIHGEGETKSRKEILQNSLGIDAGEDDLLKAIQNYFRENENGEAWIWLAPNAKDVCGYYYLISQLKKYQGKIYTVWLNNLPFLNDKRLIFYPQQLREIAPKEFVKAKRLAQLVTGAVFETDPDEWERLRKENKMLRVRDGGKKIVSKPDRYFDRYILNQVKKEGQKSDKIIKEAAKEIRGIVNERFLLWRLRELAAEGMITASGNWEYADNFDVQSINNEEVVDE